VTNTISRKTLKLMPAVTFGGSIGGDIEGGSDTPSEPQVVNYIDEYGVNHGPGVKIGETVWAPVNCGYHATDFKYGKLYQWGRKYGQGYNGSLYSGSKYIGDYSDVSVPDIVDASVSISTGQSKANENEYYYDSSDWCNPHNDELWNSGSESNPVKAEYDPCPDGWRVPTTAELNKLGNNYSSWTTNEYGQCGIWFSGPESYSSSVPRVFFPAAGFRYYTHDGYAIERGKSGNYWSSSPSSSFLSYRLRFDSSGVSGSNVDFRADGVSVRCVQE
jgi:uncharacterized protein (TIGR02145 family)